ncbi:MAG TPA: hypothetical protein VLA89_19350, partial [Gemmatimonadales bacterium]|nr:hypothetical protein [Gemmatimonadales bacterium]
TMFSSLNGRAAVLAIVAFLISGCEDRENAGRVLSALGFSDVEMTGPRFIGCGRGDFYQTGFRARGPTGQEVTGVVCSGFGWGKSSTVRID